MDDEFLYGLRQPPPPAFAAALKERLRARTDKERRDFSPRLLKTAACVAAFTVAVSAFASPSVRAVGGSFLEAFGFAKFAFVSGEADQPAQATSQKDAKTPESAGGRDVIAQPGGTSSQAGRTTPNIDCRSLVSPGSVPKMSAAVGKPLQDAVVLLRSGSGKYAEALALAQEADRTPNKTAYEACVTTTLVSEIIRMSEIIRTRPK